MKRITLLVPLCLSLLNPALAGSIPKEQVSADAKWLVHLEASQFRATKVGGYVTTEVLEKQLARFAGQLKEKVKLDLDAKKIIAGINSITIYGTDYQSPQDHAVLLIGTSPELQKIFVGFLAGMVLAGTNAPVQVTQTVEGSVTFYAIPNAAYCAVVPDKVIAIGRSREATENAAKVLDGKAPNLASGTAFAGFGDPKEAFFFVGMAEGFNLGNNLPPQARLLQVADAARIALGENSDHVFLSLALRAKTPDVVAEMQQVVQGLIAIGSLSQPQDKNLGSLLQSIKVSTNGNIVTVRADYPVEKAIEQLTQAGDKMLKHHGGMAESNRKETPKPESDNGSSAPPSTK
ncbi:MAG: hypothetical protein ACLQVX_24375 [Limisphaerales bacterium]